MNFFESIRMALSAIRANKMRSSLTLLGVVIGVMTIIAAQSLISGFRKSINEQLSGLGSNVFQVQKFPAVGGDWHKYRNRKNITVEEADAVRKYVTAAKAVGAEVWEFGKEVRFEDKKTPPSTTIAGATPEFLENNGYEMGDGRFLSEQDVDYSRRVAVVGIDVIQELFPYQDPIGKDIKIEGERFKVVGIFGKMGSMMGNSKDNRVVIPITRFEKLYGKWRSINITIMAESPELISVAMDQTIGVMRAARKVPFDKPNDFEIRTNEMMTDFFDNMTKIIRIVAIAIASISLLVAGVGIMNIMLVSVTERTREIGIRKSLGAKKRDVLWQFLIEAVVLTEVGGILGILLGIGVAKFVESVAPVPAAIPVGLVIFGLVFCSGVGLIFGVYPANKAAKLDPITALRYE